MRPTVMRLLCPVAAVALVAACAATPPSPSSPPSTPAPPLSTLSPTAVSSGAAAAPTSSPISALPTATSVSTPTTRPSPSSESTTIDGTFQTSFTKADLAASPLLIDQEEINDENWGDLTITFKDGRVSYTQTNAVESSGASGTFTVKDDTVTLAFDHGVNVGETFAYRWRLNDTTLTFIRGVTLGLPGPTPLLIRPWTSSTTTPVPTELRHIWVGETRKVAALTPPPVQSGLELKFSEMGFYGAATGVPALTSSASLVSGQLLRFGLIDDGAGCQRGDLGSYAFTLSPSGRALSLHVVEDRCAARIEATSGDWIRTDCPDVHNWCLGAMDPGTHVSVVFTPFVPPSAWHYDYGRFSFTVPDGWRNEEDAPSGYAFAKEGAAKDTGIFIFSDVVAHSQDAACPAAPEPGIGRTASAITEWLASLPGVRATKPARVTIGGLDGFTLDVSIDPTWTRTCEFSEGKPAVTLFTGSSGADFDWGLLGDGRMRLFVLDLGDRRALVIDIESQSKATWDALVAEAMPIVESFGFHE